MNSILNVECKTCNVKMQQYSQTISDVGIKDRMMEKTFYKCPMCGKKLIQRRIVAMPLKK